LLGSSLFIDKFSVSQMGQIIYQQNHEPKFYTGLLGNNNYRISTSRFELNGLEVLESGKVTFSNGINIPNGASGGKVLTSDRFGNASWHSTVKTHTLSIPGCGFNNNRPTTAPVKNYNGFVMSTDDYENRAMKLSYPLVLPDGAEIIAMEFTAIDKTDVNFTLRLYSNDFSTEHIGPPNGYIIIEVQSTGNDTGDRSFEADLSGLSQSGLTINNNKIYYLELTWEQVPGFYEGDMIFERAFMRYSH